MRLASAAIALVLALALGTGALAAARAIVRAIRGPASSPTISLPAATPFTLDGPIEQIAPERWVVNDITVALATQTAVAGTPAVGAVAHVRGDVQSDATLLVRSITVDAQQPAATSAPAPALPASPGIAATPLPMPPDAAPGESDESGKPDKPGKPGNRGKWKTHPLEPNNSVCVAYCLLGAPTLCAGFRTSGAHGNGCRILLAYSPAGAAGACGLRKTFLGGLRPPNLPSGSLPAEWGVGCRWRQRLRWEPHMQDTPRFPRTILAELPDPCGPARSTTEELAQKRYVVAGDYAYSIGMLDGSFPPIGTRIRGEMGGVWAQPIKLLQGYWFALNGDWLPSATRFTSGAGYVQMQLPALNGIEITRTEFSPDGLAALLVGLTLQNATMHDQRVALKLAARSQLMAAYPWNDTTPSADELNGKDTASYDPMAATLTFHTPNRHWYAIIGASLPPSYGAVDDDIWGPVPEAQRDGYSQAQYSAGAMLRWDIALAAGEERTLWLAVAGSHTTRAEAEETLRLVLADPAGLLHAKIRARTDLLAQVQLELPDPDLMAALEWATLNMADLRRTVIDAQIRDVDEGKDYPPPVATMPELSGIGDGFPDYPSFYGTGSGYIVYPLAASGMWETAMDHLRLLRDVSRAINGTSGKVVHEIICDGSVHFGNNAAPGDTNETALFATAVELLWRWSGDDGFRDEMYDFVVDGMRYITTELDRDTDLWPEGNGIAEREGMGSEHVDVAAGTWQALRALRRMAEGKGDQATAAWAKDKAHAMEAAFDEAWWVAAKSLYADSRCNADDIVSERERQEQGWTNVCVEPNQQLQQGIWVSVTPMETSLAPAERAHAAISTLESPAYSDACGLYLVGEGGGPDGKAVKKCWTVMAGVMALAEANYGRVGAEQALRYMQAIASLIDLEQPGAIPELAPSPDYDPFTDLTERMMFMQAWATYGISWTIVRCLLGVDADIPAGRLSVVPQIPPSWPGLAAKRLRLGSGAIVVTAERDDGCFHTRVEAPAGWRLTIGHTLPAGTPVQAVTLDGAPADYQVVDTIRGREVRIETTTAAPHALVVQTAESDTVLTLAPQQARVQRE